MFKLKKSFKITIQALGVFFISASLIFPFNANAVVEGSPFDQEPVPSFSPVVSTLTSTTAVIPDKLAKEWRGLYTRPAKSLLTRSADVITPADLKIGFKNYLVSWINNKPRKQITKTYQYNPSAVYEWTGQIANSVNQPASEPKLKIEGGKVIEFVPPQTGKILDRYQSTLKIMDSLRQGQNSVELTVNSSEPKNSLGSLNNLGINELIGRGESKFNSSPANRRFNIKKGVEKMTGIIIKPGEVFSFNKYLGPVEASTGFLPELVIKGDQGTIPEFGGGLCQVSSTTFRAAMHAGLPIVERRNHSYAVQYYAPQGSDATIYPGAVDLKFTNDTGNSILIWPYFKDPNYLVFDFYGTYDGRKVKLGNPYSYDKKSDGSMKATWKRTVTSANGVTKDDVFNSVYQPPAKFHKQESFASGNAKTDPNIVPFVGTPPTSTETPPASTPPETTPTTN